MYTKSWDGFSTIPDCVCSHAYAYKNILEEEGMSLCICSNTS